MTKMTDEECGVPLISGTIQMKKTMSAEQKMLIVDKLLYNDVKYALCAVYGEGAHYIDGWDFLKTPPPTVGDCKGCVHFHQEIFSSRYQKCLRMNGIVDYYVKTKLKVDG